MGVNEGPEPSPAANDGRAHAPSPGPATGGIERTWTEETNTSISLLASEGGLPEATLRLALEPLVRGTQAKGELDALVLLDQLIVELDDRLGAEVDAILHAPPVQRLEAAWRGLAYLVERFDSEQNVRVEFWNVRREELEEDFATSPSLTRSTVFRQLYTSEFGQFGGCPYAAFLFGFEIGPSVRDLELLRSLAAIAAMAHAPAFFAASPRMLLVDRWEELPALRDLDVLAEDPRLARYRAFRARADSRYVGLLLPRMLMRAPHSSAETFTYEEETRDVDDMLWGSPIYAVGAVLARSFSRHRWCAEVTGVGEGGGGEVDAPAPVFVGSLIAQRHPRPSTDAIVTEDRAATLARAGLISLVHRPEEPLGGMAFFSMPSVQRPEAFGSQDGGADATLNFFLGTQLPYLLIACRIGHYVKVVQREMLGMARSADEIVRGIDGWLGELIVDMENPQPEVRARKPLRGASVKRTAHEERPGWYEIALHVRPHLRYLGTSFTLSVNTRIDRR